ncbi:Aste57867_4967 [Aphanomyces stellatus]|uniref:Mitochondrial inner membrane protease subunit n=1 Tax=Aphanomyces stellatus TaxID=120398 RepID=A0A485KH08_9STRA|nr:hypothetical protein As57867_004954 [Aphanomyces stellatus]VFT82055.1 Aste57867_4967 [Aphanomyces stellatus]
MTRSSAVWASAARITLGWLPVGIAFNSLVLSWGRVEGKSMQPTINRDTSSGDIVMLDKFSVQVRHRLVRGDVVVLKSPSNPTENLTKRLIAIEGDWVEGRSGRRVVVPAGKCWVEGDNAEVSEDSNDFGCVPMALIESRVVAIVWPLNHIAAIPNKLPPNRIL